DLLVRTAKPAPYATPDATGHDPVFGFGIINPLAALKDALGITDGPADAGPDASTGPANPPENADSCGCRFIGQTTVINQESWAIYALTGLVFAVRRRKRR
ncbi:MAG TPA: serine protease, partial [Polyangium sp.]|nr:serine protease [Polyangium sp.]